MPPPNAPSLLCRNHMRKGGKNGFENPLVWFTLFLLAEMDAHVSMTCYKFLAQKGGFMFFAKGAEKQQRVSFARVPLIGFIWWSLLASWANAEFLQ